MLERQKVADDVKGLDQPARATLRKYGVRFGAYHIYLPNLLKPAPRVLAAQLWALKHMAPDAKGLDELRALASSGRTSIPIDKDIARPLYRTVGYRVCGERAVRVDILERLADLIRPALAWREGSPIPKAAGAVAGGGFTITPAMTSLTGASGEDFASVLRSLGYRMERKPKPAEAAPVASVEPVAHVPESGEGPETAAGSEGDSAPVLEAAPAAEPEALPEADTPAEVVVAPPAEAAIAATEEAPAAESSATESAPAETTPAAPAAEDTMIEVWRPGRPSSERHQAKPRRHRRPEQAVTEGAAAPAAPAQTDGVAVEGAEAAQPQHKPRPQHHRKDDKGGPPRHQRQDRKDRPDRGQERGRPPRRDKDRNQDRGAYAKQQQAPERREKVADPNSPFAKLAALKAQLEADSKERR